MTIAMEKIIEDVIVLDLNANDESEITGGVCAFNSITIESFFLRVFGLWTSQTFYILVVICV